MGCFNWNTGDNCWWIIILILLAGDNCILNNIRGLVCGENLWIIIILLLLCNNDCDNNVCAAPSCNCCC